MTDTFRLIGPRGRQKREAGAEAGAGCSYREEKALETLERAMGIEPTTRSLGSYCSTTELHPL